MARSSFLLRRTANRLLRDPLDWVWRRATGRGHLPPYSMRQFIGGAAGFEAAGAWFAQELQRLDLLPPGARLLDLGCGCGRLALGLMRDPALQSQDLRYWGLDVDPRAIGWCRRHITVAHPNFAFIHADVRNDSYHPAGASTVVEYALPLPDSSLDLVEATSLFTHLQTAELSRYHREAARVLAPGGRLYASYFLFESWEEAARESPHRPLRFTHRVDTFSAAVRAEAPEDAIAYHRPFLQDLWRDCGLEIETGPMLGVQDIVILRKV